MWRSLPQKGWLSGSCRGELVFAAIYGHFKAINRRMWRQRRPAEPAITAIPNDPNLFSTEENIFSSVENPRSYKEFAQLLIGTYANPY
jgi:hypothetical protein